MRMKDQNLEELRQTAEAILPLLREMFGEEVPFAIRNTYRTNRETVSICVQLPHVAQPPGVDALDLPESGSVEEMANAAAALLQARLQRIQNPGPGESPLYTRERVLERVVLQVLNRETNARMMEHCPHVEHLDLAGVFRVPLEPVKRGTLLTTLLRWREVQMLGLTVPELYDAARENTVRSFGVEVIRTDKMCAQLRKYGAWYGKPLEQSCMADPGSYNVTNTIRINGAALLLIPEVLKILGEKLGGDYFVVPTSIHEFLVRRDNGEPDLPVMLQASVIAGNCTPTVVSHNTVLSDSLYRYRCGSGVLELAAV